MTDGAALATSVASFCGAAAGSVLGALYGLHFVARRLPGIMWGAPQVTPVGNLRSQLDMMPGQPPVPRGCSSEVGDPASCPCGAHVEARISARNAAALDQPP